MKPHSPLRLPDEPRGVSPRGDGKEQMKNAKVKFLFDDTKSSQRGKGCDRLGSKEDGLKWDWKWGTKEEGRKTPGQICSAYLPFPIKFKVGKGSVENCKFFLRVVFWHTEYEASLEMGDHGLLSYTSSDEKSARLITRVDAQRKAEELLNIFYKGVIRIVTSLP
ncbi:hypothetical protein IIA15_00375 [candidate division TA06 bacterium]|nr:hypothetical protein [candidate division TA06 bacterium]